jgi:ferric-dicitrate binding protein FerR (iron transport regulator)
MRPEADPHDGLDERLRRQLEPDPEAVERVVRRALAAEPEPRPPRRPAWRRWLAVGAMALLAGFLALWIGRPGPAGPRPGPGPSGQVSVTNQGAVLIVRRPGDRIALVHTGPAAPGAGPSILVLTQGDTP